jgi:hypothetical protein
MVSVSEVARDPGAHGSGQELNGRPPSPHPRVGPRRSAGAQYEGREEDAASILGSVVRAMSRHNDEEALAGIDLANAHPGRVAGAPLKEADDE